MDFFATTCKIEYIIIYNINVTTGLLIHNINGVLYSYLCEHISL